MDHVLQKWRTLTNGPFWSIPHIRADQKLIHSREQLTNWIVNTQGSSVLSMIVLNHDETRKALRSFLYTEHHVTESLSADLLAGKHLLQWWATAGLAMPAQHNFPVLSLFWTKQTKHITNLFSTTTQTIVTILCCPAFCRISNLNIFQFVLSTSCVLVSTGSTFKA